MPLIVSSRPPDVTEKVVAVGALAGIRMPMNVGTLMQAIRRGVSDNWAADVTW